jgi:hypothetical protein
MGVSVGGMRVAVGGIGVSVGGMRVAVGGIGVSVGRTRVAVIAIASVGWSVVIGGAVDISVAVACSSGDTGVVGWFVASVTGSFKLPSEVGTNCVGSSSGPSSGNRMASPARRMVETSLRARTTTENTVMPKISAATL